MYTFELIDPPYPELVVMWSSLSGLYSTFTGSCY